MPLPSKDHGTRCSRPFHAAVQRGVRMADPASSRSAELPGTTIRFLLRSTFIDCQGERNVLQRHVFP